MLINRKKIVLYAIPFATCIYLMTAGGGHGGDRGGSGGSDRFDREMTPSQRRDTGIDKLSPDERSSLDNWIDQNYTHQNHPKYFNPNQTHHIIQNWHGGSSIQLEDGSVYEISPDDVGISSLWVVPFPLVVQENNNNNPQYPYVLVNQNTGASVQAKQTQPPSSNTPSNTSSGGSTGGS